MITGMPQRWRGSRFLFAYESNVEFCREIDILQKSLIR